jgi:hypothetical protein
MLAFVTPPDVSRSFKIPPEWSATIGMSLRPILEASEAGLLVLALFGGRHSSAQRTPHLEFDAPPSILTNLRRHPLSSA